jgi:hypothetical protein
MRIESRFQRFFHWRLDSWDDAPGCDNIAPLALTEKAIAVAEMILQFARMLTER